MPPKSRYQPPKREDPVYHPHPPVSGSLGQGQPIMTPDELAEALRTTKRAVLDNHEIPRFKLGKAVRYSRAEIEAWIAGKRGNRDINLGHIIEDHFKERAPTVSGLARLFRVSYRDAKATNPPLKWPLIVEWLIDN